MASQFLPGAGLWIPAMWPAIDLAPALSGVLVMDASAEKVGLVGRVYTKDGAGATKSLTGVGFMFGAVTKSGLLTTDIQVALQDVSLTTGDPDGTDDQTVLVGNAQITANTWREVTFGAARTVTHGDLLSVVFTFSLFVALDSVVINSLTNTASQGTINNCYADLDTGAWAKQTRQPIIVLIFGDGTYGTLDGAHVGMTYTATTFNSGSAADELALWFTVPFPCVCDGAWVMLDLDNDAEIVLYEGTTAKATVAIDKDVRVSTAGRIFRIPFPRVTIAANTAYYLAVKPGASNVTAYSVVANNATYFQALEGGTSFNYATRVDAGAWTQVSGTRLWGGVRLNGFDDATGGAAAISARVVSAGAVVVGR